MNLMNTIQEQKPYVEENNSAVPGVLRPLHVQVFEAYEEYWARRGYAPVMREVAGSIGATLRSVQRIVPELVAMGCLVRLVKTGWRSYKPLKHPREVFNQ